MTKNDEIYKKISLFIIFAQLDKYLIEIRVQKKQRNSSILLVHAVFLSKLFVWFRPWEKLVIFIEMDQESAMMIFLSYQKLRMPTFSKFICSPITTVSHLYLRCSTTTNRKPITWTITRQKIYRSARNIVNRVPLNYTIYFFLFEQLFSTATATINDKLWQWTHGNRSSKNFSRRNTNT